MKHIAKIFTATIIASAALMTFSACDKDNINSNGNGEIDKVVTNDDRIQGKWHTYNEATDTDVNVIFKSDKTFVLSQKTGKGRPVKYTGNWYFNENAINGSYFAPEDQKVRSAATYYADCIWGVKTDALHTESVNSKDGAATRNFDNEEIHKNDSGNIKPYGTPWASAYTVEFNEDNSQMTWTAVLDPTDVNVYTRVVTE